MWPTDSSTLTTTHTCNLVRSELCSSSVWSLPLRTRLNAAHFVIQKSVSALSGLSANFTTALVVEGHVTAILCAPQVLIELQMTCDG